MRKVTILLLGFCLMSLTSCIDMLEELYLNKDGSGTYSITFDMSGLFSDPMMKGMMEELLQGEDGLSFDHDLSQVMDTMIMFSDMSKEGLQKMEKPEFWKKVSMRIVMNEGEKAFRSEVKLNFTSLDDIDYFYKNLDKLGANEAGGGMGSMASFLPTRGLFKLNKRNLQRLPAPKVDSSLNGEEMDMAKMFFSAASYKTTYHLPGRVARTTIPGAVVDGKTITITNSFLDIMEGKAKLDGEIKYKKR